MYVTDYIEIGFVTVIAVIGIKAAITRGIRIHQAQQWLPADGEIVYTGNWLHDLLWEIDYCYKVDGAYYSGRFWKNPLYRNNIDPTQGRSVRVRYQPDRPQTSYLLDSDQK
jgi:hypothetical protein